MNKSQSKVSFTDGFPWLLIILLACITALDAMAIDMYLPAFSAISQSLQVDSAAIQYSLSYFIIGLAIGQLIFGPVVDRFGRRKPLLIGILIFSIGSVIAALAQSFEILLLARFIQALGAAAGVVIPRAIISDLFSHQQTAVLFSVLMQVFMLAPIIAPILGGWILIHFSWHAIFWCISAISFICLIWSFFSLKESLKPEKALTHLNISVVLQSYFKELKNLPFMTYTIASGFLFGSFLAYLGGTPVVILDIFNLSPTQFGYIFAFNAVGFIIFGQVNTLLLSRISQYKLAIIGLTIHVIASLINLILFLTDQLNVYSFIFLLWLAISALGLVWGNLTALALQYTQDNAGTASALFGIVQYLLGALLAMLLGLLLQDPLVKISVIMTICGAISLFSIIGQKYI
ncbi:hypothetical protein BJI46_13660 [Acinetobacter qingfengensis]|uniref:Bcr/CflA family efflux transporter n=1 Tax=Acinetobacter qingfengensis TaxID=1262585 RepID=A0A1E7R405_9GAMM|nr:hypothetical protein BJI46_13660 [Acinetobacter qingfengensis]